MRTLLAKSILLAIISMLTFSLISCAASVSTSGTTGIVLTSTNFINLRGDITKENADFVIQAYKDLRKANKTGKIYLVVESGGGYISEGVRIITVLKKDKNLDTITIIANSMASAIVEALPGKRYIIPKGIMMFHRASGAPTMEMVESLELSNARRMQISIDRYRMNILTDWWLKGAEANIKDKAADEVTEISCDKSALKKFDNHEFMEIMFGIRMVNIVKILKCPLVVKPLP